MIVAHTKQQTLNLSHTSRRIVEFHGILLQYSILLLSLKQQRSFLVGITSNVQWAQITHGEKKKRSLKTV